MKAVLPHRARIASAVVIVLIAALTTLFVACSGTNPAIDNAGGSPTPGGGGGSCNPPGPGCGCESPGATRECGSVVGSTGNSIVCAGGTMVCGRDYTWGACNGAVRKEIPRERIVPLVLGLDAGSCNNPCDPYCEGFSDTAVGLDAGADSGLIVTDSGLSLVVSPNPPPHPCTSVTVTPEAGTLTVTSLNPSPLPTYQFTAHYSPANCTPDGGGANALWAVVPASIGQIDNTGNVTVVNPVAGPLTVTASARAAGDAGLLSATGTLTVNDNILDTSNAPGGVTSGQLSGAGSGVDGLSILYPYANTVLPLGLIPPTVQWVGGNPVLSIAVTNGGSGYTYPTTVAISAPPSGTAATATATLNASVSSVTVNAGGSYSSAPSITIAPPTSGTTATATAVINGVITGYTLTNGGSYTNAPPVVTIAAPPSGTTATATAVLNATVTSTTVTTAGSYAAGSTVPSITFSGGGSGATQATGAAVGGLATVTRNANAYSATYPPPGGTGWSTTANTAGQWSAALSGGNGAVNFTIASATNGIVSGTLGTAGAGYLGGASGTCLAKVTTSTGSGAIIEVQIAAGAVMGASVIYPGTGYAGTDTWKPATTGTNNCGTPTTSAGNSTVNVATFYYVSAASVGLAGTYNSGTTVPTFTITPTGGTANQTCHGTTTIGINSINVSTAGTGYTSQPTIAFSSGSAAATATVVGPVASLSITNPGTGYQTPPAVTFSSGAAAATVSITGPVVSVTVNNGGSGYTSPPAVTFGSGAASGTANISGSIAAVTVTSPGSGYTSAPTVSFSGAPGTGATATATLAGATAVKVSLLYPADGSIFTYAEIVPELTTLPGPSSVLPAQPRATFSTAAWNAFAQSAIGQTAYISVQRLTGGTLYPAVTTPIRFATNQLKGTVYYQSYGTNLAYSLSRSPQPGYFGGATLSIQPGSSAPTLTEGYTSLGSSCTTGPCGSGTGCRVCHTVASDGNRLITVNYNSYQSTTLDLPGTQPVGAQNAGEAAMLSGGGGTQNFTWSAMYHDGSFLFTNGATAIAGGGQQPSTLYTTTGTGTKTSPAAVSGVSGLPSINAGTPSFSPDGKHIAFNYVSGGSGTIGGTSGDDKSLGAIDFDGVKTFSNARLLATPGSASMTIPSGGTGKSWWPSFTPDGKNVIFEFETYGNGGSNGRGGSGDIAATRSDCESGTGVTDTCHNEGVHGELWWVNATGTASQKRMNCANGVIDTNCPNVSGTNGTTPYLPPDAAYSPIRGVAATYGADWNLNYEPTILPQQIGGYSWVVFTSRRMYGNIATINGFNSDPRYVDISTQPTPKKLWVAAINPSPTAGNDPSYPAFYLDGQELLAGNSRANWVLNACEPAYSSSNPSASLCTSDLDCCSGESCVLDSPLPSPATSHCQSVPAICYGGAPVTCTSAKPCCDSLAVCSQQTNTCVEPPPVPYYVAADFTRIYSNPCPAGKRPIWQNFEYGSITPSDSSITVEVETANNPAYFTQVDDAGASNPQAPLVQLPGAISGATVTYPNGTKNVEAALLAANLQSALYLQVTVRFLPSSDGFSAPSLVQWGQQVDCVDSQ